MGGGEATPAGALGMLSLIVWTLIITTRIKYVAIVMRADNDGEGGILALMALLGIKHGERAGVIALGILGAALLYGDGAITPAISVLSSLEGIKTPLPAFAPYVLPLSIFVLIALFCLQPLTWKLERDTLPLGNFIAQVHSKARVPCFSRMARSFRLAAGSYGSTQTTSTPAGVKNLPANRASGREL